MFTQPLQSEKSQCNMCNILHRPQCNMVYITEFRLQGGFNWCLTVDVYANCLGHSACVMFGSCTCVSQTVSLSHLMSKC